MPTVATLNTHHPDWDFARLERLRALVEGGTRWHALKAQMFPRYPFEPQDAYDNRLKLIRYTNHSGAILGLFAAMLFAEAAHSDQQGPYWERVWDNCDGAGTNWQEFWRERFIDAQVGRRSWVWVNLPARDAETPEPNNQADQEKAGLLDAYLVPLLPEQVHDWGCDDTGKVIWVLFRSVSSERAGPDSPRTKVWRWRYIDATQIRTWEWKPPAETPDAAPPPDASLTERPAVDHGFGVLPVVCLEMPMALWAGNKLEDPALDATTARNDLGWALHMAANELLTIVSREEVKTPTLGHGFYLQLMRDKEGSDAASYVAPSGVAFDHLAKNVAHSRDEVYRVVQQLALSADPDASRMRQSGESKGQDWKASEIILAAYAGLVREAMENAIRLMSRARGKVLDTVSVSGLDGWQNEDLMTFLEASALAVDARQLSPSFRRVIAKRQARRLLGDEVDEATLRAIEDEIDTADPDLLNPMLGFRPPPIGGEAGGSGPDGGDET